MSARSYRPQDLHRNSISPPVLAAEGFFWVGVSRRKSGDGTICAGQMYVEYRIPAELRRPWPIVMIHGGGGQGLNFLGTPDGRTGWAQYFLRQGYAIYVVDRHGHGRAPYHPECLGPMTTPATYEFIADRFAHPERLQQFPQAHLHTQWPDDGADEGVVLDQFLASTGPRMTDDARAQLEMQRCGALLLDAIGPSILLTHSAGGPSGWLIADARPDAVKAILAVEPAGTPFEKSGPARFDWGITSAPLTFDPPAATAQELKRELRRAPAPDLVDCYVQVEPARRLPNLCGFPIAVVTAEASWMAQDNHGIVDLLLQAGARVEHVRLEHLGVHGNGHAMMLEKNSDDVAAALHDWLAQQGLAS
jgi:pimeloyl-ACP methyl ester carboxylesterase